MASVKTQIASLIAAAALAGGVAVTEIPDKPQDTILPNEIVSARTVMSKTFDKGGGKKEIIVGAEPLNWNDNGSLKTIDNAVKDRPLFTAIMSKYEYESDIGIGRALFDKDSDSDYGFVIGSNSIEYTMLSDTTAISIKTEMLNIGVKQTYVMSSDKALSVLRWRIDTGLAVTVNKDMSVTYSDGDITIMSNPPPIAWDAKGIPVEVIVTVSHDTLTYTVNTTGKTYPITVDPTIVAAPTGTMSTGIYSRSSVWTSGAGTGARDTTSYFGITALNAGSSFSGGDYFVNRGHLIFDTSSLPDSAIIDSASVNMGAVTTDNVSTGFTIQLVQATTSDTSATPAMFNDFTGWATTGAYSVTNLWASLTASNYNVGDSLKSGLNNSGKAAINKTGYTRFFFLSSADIANTTPVALDYIATGTYGTGAYIRVYYAESPPPTPTDWNFLETTLFHVAPGFTDDGAIPATTYAIRDSTRMKWISATGATSDTSVWRTEAQWEAIKISGLLCEHTYMFGVVGKNSYGQSAYLWDSLTMSDLFTSHIATGDGSIINKGTGYYTQRNATSGDSLRAKYLWVGTDSLSSSTPEVNRTFLRIPLPEAMGSASACTLFVYVYKDSTAAEMNLYLGSAPNYPPTLTVNDFSNFPGWAASGGYTVNARLLAPVVDTTPGLSGWVPFVFSAAGLDTLVATAPDSLSMILISGFDHDNQYPSFGGSPHRLMAFYNSTNVGFEPYLSFTYTDASPSEFAVVAEATDSLALTWTLHTTDEDSVLVKDAVTNLWVTAVGQGIEAAYVPGLGTNTFHSYYVEIKGGAGNGLTSATDSSYTYAETPGLSTVSFPANNIMKIILDPGTNSSFTHIAIQDSVSGNYVHLLGSGVLDTLGASADWHTYSEWGAANGCSLAVNPGQELRIRAAARNTAQ